jgi:hypothetical protein
LNVWLIGWLLRKSVTANQIRIIIWVLNSTRMRWVGLVVHMEDRRGAYWILVGKPEGKRPLQRLRHRWEDNIIVDLQEIGWTRLGPDSPG